MDNINLVKWLKGTSEIEISNGKVLLPYKQAKTGINVYFCCGLGKGMTTRCKDGDIKTKKYYCVDIDIRLDYYEKTGNVLSQEEMINESRKILQKLNKTEYNDYCSVVDSGNGIHLYYTGKERSFKLREYSEGVGFMFDEIDVIIHETGYKTDKAVKNIARIMRLPGTINPRKKIKKDKTLFDLGNTECKVLFFENRDSKSFELIETKAKEYHKQKEKEKLEQKQIKEIIKKDYEKPSDVWEKINNIPACNIACDIRGVTIIDGGLDNVALKEATKNMGAYRYKPHNVIVNTGSSLISTDKSYFTSYELVYYEVAGGNKQRTLDYFKTHYNIEFEEKKQGINIPKKEYTKIGYEYGSEVFKDFDCIMSGELVTVVAEPNSGKTTFAMDMITKNASLGKKGFYINLEFAIETMRESRWINANGKFKRNLTDLDPLTEDEKRQMDKYVKSKLKQFDYYNNPDGIALENLIELIIEKEKEGCGFFVIDTFSRIKGNLVSETARTSQNASMEKLQEVCQNLGVAIVLLHHTNKQGEFEGSKKIKDLSNVFITIKIDGDGFETPTTIYSLSKDKFISSRDVKCKFINDKLILENESNKEDTFDGEKTTIEDIFSGEEKFPN